MSPCPFVGHICGLIGCRRRMRCADSTLVLALGLRMRAQFASIASSRRSEKPGIDDAGAMFLARARDPEFVWGCDSGVDRFGCGLHQSFEVVRQRSRTGDRILRRACTRHRSRSTTVRRSAGRREALTQVYHPPTAEQSSRASPGNPPPTSTENPCCCI